MPRDSISTCTGKSSGHTISLIRYSRSFLHCMPYKYPLSQPSSRHTLHASLQAERRTDGTAEQDVVEQTEPGTRQHGSGKTNAT